VISGEEEWRYEEEPGKMRQVKKGQSSKNKEGMDQEGMIVDISGSDSGS